ncbi:MAG: glycosyltransferase family 2 protein [Armatimonadota bacterium]
MDLSIAIVSWNTRELLDDCLRSIFDTTQGIEYEVIVVDNKSSDDSVDMVRSTYPQVKFIENQDNVGFPKANNQAYQVSSGRHFMLLNPDTICREGSLAGLVRFLDEHSDAGAVGPLVLNPDETLQYSWARFPRLITEIRGILDRRIEGFETPTTAEQVREMGPFVTDWIGGCALVIRRTAVEQIGLMDESFFMYNEETDWCYRLHKQGWSVWVEPSSEIVHLGGQSSSRAKSRSAKHLRDSKRHYFSKHHGMLSGGLLYAILSAKCCIGNVISFLRDN